MTLFLLFMSSLRKWGLKANLIFFLYPLNEGKDEERGQGSNTAGAYLARRLYFPVRLRISVRLHPGTSEQHSDKLFVSIPPPRVHSARHSRAAVEGGPDCLFPAFIVLKLLLQPQNPLQLSEYQTGKKTPFCF